MAPKILVVDDEKEIREALIELLNEEGGFYIVQACCGEEAIGFVSEQRFDVIVSDLCMSPVDGLSFFAHIEKNKLNTPFILFSGSEVQLPYMEYPFLEFVKKPNFSRVVKLIMNQVNYEASNFGT